MLLNSMQGPAYFFHWHLGSIGGAPIDIYISAANLTVIVLMVVVFALAVLLPFPGRSAR